MRQHKKLKRTTWFDTPGRGFSLYERLPQRERDPIWEPEIGELFAEPGDPGYVGPQAPTSSVRESTNSDAQPASPPEQLPAPTQAPSRLSRRYSPGGDPVTFAPSNPPVSSQAPSNADAEIEEEPRSRKRKHQNPPAAVNAPRASKRARANTSNPPSSKFRSTTGKSKPRAATPRVADAARAEPSASQPKSPTHTSPPGKDLPGFVPLMQPGITSAPQGNRSDISKGLESEIVVAGSAPALQGPTD